MGSPYVPESANYFLKYGFLIPFFWSCHSSAIKIFNWVATLHRGSIDLKNSNVFCPFILFLFTIGGLTGLYLGTLSTDILLHDTYFVVAHFHYVMFGTVIAFFGGLHFGGPKCTVSCIMILGSYFMCDHFHRFQYDFLFTVLPRFNWFGKALPLLRW